MRIDWYYAVVLGVTFVVAIVAIALELLRRRGVIGERWVSAVDRVGDFINRFP